MSRRKWWKHKKKSFFFIYVVIKGPAQRGFVLLKARAVWSPLRTFTLEPIKLLIRACIIIKLRICSRLFSQLRVLVVLNLNIWSWSRKRQFVCLCTGAIFKLLTTFNVWHTVCFENFVNSFYKRHLIDTTNRNKCIGLSALDKIGC